MRCKNPNELTNKRNLRVFVFEKLYPFVQYGKKKETL